MAIRKLASTLVLSFILFPAILFAAISFSLTTSVSCYAQGCMGQLNTGDTEIWGGWSNSGSFILNGSSIAGSVFGTFNDGESQPCAAIPAGGNLGIFRLVNLDFNTPSNGNMTNVNCMADYGLGGSPAWAPATSGTCSSGVVSACNWKSLGMTHVSGNMYLFIFRQNSGGNFDGYDSSIIVSSNEGVGWLNPSNIGGTPSITGDVPKGPGDAKYPTSMAWTSAVASTAYMARPMFVHYCRDESISCPSIDNNATYTYGISTNGTFTSDVYFRWPKTSMPTLDTSTMQYYVCPGYSNTVVCDPAVSGNWTNTLASATIIPVGIFSGVNTSISYDNGKSTYIAVSWDGAGNYFVMTAPNVIGPWTLGSAFTPQGLGANRSVFANIIQPTILDVNSTTSTFAIGTSSNISGVTPAGGSPFFDLLLMTVPSGPSLFQSKMSGSNKVLGKATIH